MDSRRNNLKSGLRRRSILVAVILAVAGMLGSALPVQTALAQQQQRPNILVIWGDDIGGFNISAYNRGMMGYRTPNIDRIANEGALFTDWYGQQSCTAGRAAFITGQSPIRTGLTKVGLPGAPEGMKKEDPTIAGLLRPLGYVTGQFGKNHLGDRDDMLPTVHGFDEFLGNLYHLNATTMFRGEKNTNWEGGYRVPTVIRWPGVIKPGTVINDIGAHEDMLTTLLAAAGNPNVKDELLKGKTVGNVTYKVHLDGYNLMPALKGEGAWPRKEFFYWTDDGSVAALRHENWKVTFLKQNAEGMRVWQKPFEELRAPLLANLRMDPFERAEAEDAMGFQRWWIEHMYAIAPAAAYVGQWLQSFREFPPRQKPGSFNLDRVMEAVTRGASDK